MSQPDALSLEGTVVAVAADGGHRFSKPTRDRIVLLEGHGVEGDAHAGPFVRHRYLARRRPRAPNLRQVHLIPSELFRSLSKAGFEVAAGDWARTSPQPAWTSSECRSGRLLSSDPWQ